MPLHIIILSFFFGFTGISSSDSKGDSSTELSKQLCSAENFTPSKWQTLGRMDANNPPHCPLVGEYTGIIPDAEGLCAKSYADCNNPEVMFYTVFNCNNATEIYEEREYRCFGQWRELETGLVYTYTERRDILGQECFVGVDVDQDKSIVTEAGSNCERGHQPRKYGMTLQRQAKCPTNSIHGSSMKSLQNSGAFETKNNGLNQKFKYIEDKILRDSNDEGSDSYYDNRPVSPRLSTVHGVVIDSNFNSNNDQDTLGVRELEQVLDKIERQEEERYYESEMNTNSDSKHHNSKYGRDHKKHRKHGHRHGGSSGSDHNNSGEYDQDIFSNEIPESPSSSKDDSSAGKPVASIRSGLFTTIVCLLCCIQQAAYHL